MESETRKQRILDDRDAGMTYTKIAEKHGVSRSYVGQVCAQSNQRQFRVIKEDSCIYPNWRKWMNNEKCSRYELLRRMGFAPHNETSSILCTYMKGKHQPRKNYIDKLLEVTGMTYEKLFALEGDDGK